MVIPVAYVLRVFILERASSIQYGYRKCGNLCTSVLQNTSACEQQDWNKPNKDKGEEGKEIGMNVEKSTVGTKSPIELNVQSHLISSSDVSR